jgi:hypothetical protein
MRAAVLKEKTLYRDIVRGAWDIAWHRREFWVLGLLASLLAMNGGAFEFVIRAVYKISSGYPYADVAAVAQALTTAFSANDPTTQISVFFSIVAMLAVFALIALAAIAASGALLQVVARRALRKKQSVRLAWLAGANKVGPLIVTQLIGRIVIFTAFILAALGVYSSIDGSFGYVIGVILFVVFSLVALFVSFLMMMTNAGIMIGGERWVNACHDAFKFLKRHWVISVEMIGLVFLAALAAGVLVLAALAILVAPCLLIVLALSALHLPIVVDIVASLFVLIGIIIVLVIGSMLAVFENAAWALLYTRLANRSAVAKLERLWQTVRNLKPHERAQER